MTVTDNNLKELGFEPTTDGPNPTTYVRKYPVGEPVTLTIRYNHGVMCAFGAVPLGAQWGDCDDMTSIREVVRYIEHCRFRAGADYILSR